MSSPRMKIRCPNCRKDGSARAELVNRRVSCKHCAHVFRAVPVDDPAPSRVEPTKLLTPLAPSHSAEVGGSSKGRIEALEQEIRRLRDDLSAEVARLQPVRDQLAQALDTASKAEGREKGLREEVGQLRDQLDQTLPGTDDESRDRLRGEELRFLRDQLDKARAEVEAESRKRREAAASLTARVAEHARAVEAKDNELAQAIEARLAEHAKVLAAKETEHAQALAAKEAMHAGALAAKEAEQARAIQDLQGQLDRLRAEAQSVEARRLAADSARTEAENRHADEDRALRDELARTKGELEEARKALDGLRLERDRLAADHSRELDGLRGQLAEFEARLAEAEAARPERDRLAAELESHQARLAEADRSAAEHRQAAEGLRSERDWIEASRSAELDRLREELAATQAGRPDLDAIRLERDEALARFDEAARELESLRAQLDEGPGMSVDWSCASTEIEVPSAEVATESEMPAMSQEAVTVYDDGPGRLDLDATRAGLAGAEEFPGRDQAWAKAEADARAEAQAEAWAEAERLLEQARFQAEAEAERLKAELERARTEVEAASRQNRELADRVRTLEAKAQEPAAALPVAAVDPALIEAERKRAVDEAVKGAWADFERRLAETQAKLRAANSRADLMEIEAREARQQAAGDSSDGSSFDGHQSMTSIRILDARGTARLTPADAESRLALAKQLAVDRKDKPLIDRIGKMAEKVRADLEAHNFTLAETLVRGAEIEAGLDPGGYSIGGLRIFRPSPTIVGSLTALAPAFDRVMRQGDLATIRSTLEEMRTLLGDQAGLPELRRVGRTPAVKRPIGGEEALRLFVAALEAENWLMRPIAAKKPLPDTSLTTYACLVEACAIARKVAEEHAPERLALLDSVIRASCLMLTRRQQPDGHFSFLDPRGKASKLASVVDGMVAQRPDSVKDGWVVLVDPLGIAQAETGACGVALATAGKALDKPEWSQAALKAADWAVGQPCLPNFVANAASAGLLARAYLDTGQDRHLVGLARKLAIGLLPGQVENGRWIDASSAATPNHLTILRALHDAWEAIPPGREDLRRDLKPAINRANSSLLAECQALGVPPQGNALRELLRHRDLPGLEVDSRLEPAILDSATVIQELCHEGPKPKLGVAPDQLAALTRV